VNILVGVTLLSSTFCVPRREKSEERSVITFVVFILDTDWTIDYSAVGIGVAGFGAAGGPVAGFGATGGPVARFGATDTGVGGYRVAGNGVADFWAACTLAVGIQAAGNGPLDVGRAPVSLFLGDIGVVALVIRTTINAAGL
jgi:hypothetical protein